jgi:hypothetical protein
MSPPPPAIASTVPANSAATESQMTVETGISRP